LHDPTLAALTAEDAQQRLRGLAQAGEGARPEWSRTAVTVVTSGGCARRLEATSVAAEVRGGRDGGGFAAGAARSLDALDLPALFARARRRCSAGEPASWSPPAAVVLAPEAMAALVAALGRQ